MKANTNIRFLVSLGVALVLLSILPGVYAQEDELPELVLAERANFFPEGIEWDAVGERFLLGSTVENIIFAVTDDGVVTPFIEDEDLTGSAGIHIDTARNRLLVADVDFAVLAVPEVEGRAAVGIYDLSTGERLQLVNMRDLRSGKQTVNDLTVDAEGNIYGTDPFAPVIYQVDLEGNGSIFLEDDLLNTEPVGLIPFPVGLNGIVYHPNGYLLATHTAGGALFKISLDDPGEFSIVELDEPFGGDGMVLRPTGELVTVAATFDAEGNPQIEVLEVTSEDDWENAAITDRVNVSALPPTTVALRDDTTYVVAMHLDALMSDESVEAYEIYRVDFDTE